MPKVTSKGQVTIPHQIRAILNIRAGDDIVFEIEDAKAVLKRKSSSIENLKRYVGFLAHLNGKKTDDILDELRGLTSDLRPLTSDL